MTAQSGIWVGLLGHFVKRAKTLKRLLTEFGGCQKIFQILVIHIKFIKTGQDF